jgi:hypothetical protein
MTKQITAALALLVATSTTATTATITTATSTAPTATTATISDEDSTPGTWAGQLKVAETTSVLNYVGAESGDWVPMRFRNDSPAGQMILAACRNDETCEFTGAVKFLDEVPPENASAVGEIVRVDSVKKVTAPAQ